jgi:hypothetical protein
VVTGPDITPNFSATTLEDFGPACLNNSNGCKPFTLTGTNLTTADLTLVLWQDIVFLHQLQELSQAV